MLTDMSKLTTFFKCLKGKELEICMKQDLRRKIGEMSDLFGGGMLTARSFVDIDSESSDDSETSLIFEMIRSFDNDSFNDFF